MDGPPAHHGTGHLLQQPGHYTIVQRAKAILGHHPLASADEQACTAKDTLACQISAVRLKVKAAQQVHNVR